MKKLAVIIVSLLLSCSVFSQNDNYNRTDSQGRKQGIWKKYQDNGKLLYEGTFINDKPVGEFKRYHENGMLKALLKYDVYSDTARAELFDTHAKLIGKGIYFGQQKTGQWLYYDEGKLVSEENYRNGVKEGLSKTYYKTGELFEEQEWADNLQNGVYRAYFKSGKPYLECQMESGLRNGVCKAYHENNQLELDAFYINGLRHGEWNYYDENGNLSYTLTYWLGKLRTPEVLDSIQQLKMQEMEAGKDKIIDPEKFMQDPVEYMMKNKIYGR